MANAPSPQQHRQFLSPEYDALIDQLADEITQLSAHLNAANYQLLKLIGQFEENEGWRGYNSCAQWIFHQCGSSMGTAREKVRVARALPALPQISEAFREGRVSYSKVRAMTRVATAKNEAELLNTAMYGTATHVERQVRAYRWVKRLDALDDENRRYAARELNWYTDDDGSLVMKGRFTPEAGELIKKALEGAMQQLFEEHQAVPEAVAEETELSQLRTDAKLSSIASRRADAMERVAEGYLASKKSESSGGDRYLVNIHTELDVLKEDGDVAESELEDAACICAETSRRLACDSSVVVWREDETGNPLNIGRKSRSIPPAIRRALKRRDHGCRFPGCTCTRFVDAHHIKHWADGGETSMHNLVLLCRNHHRLIHEGGYGVHVSGESEINFTLPDGTILLPGPDKRSRGNFRSIEATNHKNGLTVTSKTAITRWDGSRMDLSMAVDALIRRE